jgi:adenosine deaminase
VIDLARSVNYTGLPTQDPRELAQWFHQGANQGSLPKYLEGFAHTIAVMQTEEALERAAYEQAEDLSEDGVLYFETRFAPIFHTQKGADSPAGNLCSNKGFGARPQGFRCDVRADYLRYAQHGCLTRDGGTGG